MASNSQKRLFLLRHAQALSDAPNDKARALSPNGVDDAQALGRLMAKQSYFPDIVLCSPALRTRQTLEALEEGFGARVSNNPEILYNGAAGDYLNEIQKVSDEYSDILLVAHNPSVYELVIRLSDPDQDSMMQRLSAGYQPATLSVLDCSCSSWKDIQFGANELSYLAEPLDYNAPARPTRWM